MVVIYDIVLKTSVIRSKTMVCILSANGIVRHLLSNKTPKVKRRCDGVVLKDKTLIILTLITSPTASFDA